MSTVVVECRRIAADWTDEHRALAVSAEAMGLPPGRPEWVEITVVVLDVDGAPAGLQVHRSAGLTNCPIPRPDDRRRLR